MIQPDKKIVKILALDGGGVRGIIPCSFLKHLRDELNKGNNHTPFHQMFDLISGTSTGALISLMLTKPPADFDDKERLDLLLDLYQNKIKDIFPAPKFEILRLIIQSFRPKYSGKALKKLLRKYLDNLTLDDSLTNLLVPAFDMSLMKPYFFKHRPHYKYNSDDLNFFLRGVGLAASAAPTYLPPVKIKSIYDNRKSYCFVDGGVFCNNPSLCAYIEARKLFPDAEKYIIVSLGTGEYTRTYDCNKIRKWGVLGWMNPFQHVPIVSSFMYSQTESVNHMLKNIPNVKLYRFEVCLDGTSSEMDDSTDTNIKFLKGKAAELILSCRGQIERLVKVLTHY